MSDLTLAAVPASLIELLWDDIAPFIDLVADKAPDDIVTSKVKENCMLGSIMPVIVYRGSDIVAVNILDVKALDSGKKVLYIPIIGGTEFDNWSEDFMKLATQIAKDFGCSELRGMAVRKGWMTKLKPLGWEEMFTTVRCKIGD